MDATYQYMGKMMLLRNSLFNLVGLGGPLLVALFTIPYLVKALGVEKFGLLTLIWALVSYFGLFDFGLGRALTQQIAVSCSLNKNRELPGIVGTAYSIMLLLGSCAGVGMAMAAPEIIARLQNVTNESEAINALYAMAVAMPFIILTSGFRGVLEARHAFKTINLIRLPMGFFTFLGPTAVVMLAEPRLDIIAWVLTIGRVIGCFVHAWFASRSLPEGNRTLVFSQSWVRPLCVSGGWLAVSNVVSPIMGYLDRFMIGALVSAAAVAYYATPNEIVTKLWIIPGALTAVLFPTFAAQIINGDNEAKELFKKALFWLFSVMAPLVLMFILFAGDILRIWISEEFSAQSATVLRILAIGILINSLAHIPFTLIQSSGNARLTAMIHLCELPVFVLILWWLTTQYGIVGAAWAWLIRMVVDTALLFRYAMPIVGLSLLKILNKQLLAGVLILPLLLWMGESSSLAVRITSVLVFALISSIVFRSILRRWVSIAYIAIRGRLWDKSKCRS